MNGVTLFIADLHIDNRHPDIAAQFLRFLHTEAQQADALYILGDLFEVWVGDDDDDPLISEILSALQRLSDSGTMLFFMHGNRDFLIGEHFAERSGCQLLPDPTVINLYGKPVLLMHGDLLCSDDTAYQEFRELVRDPEWQQQVLSKSLHERRQLAAELREQSRLHTGSKAEDIMDVTPATVTEYIQQAGVDTLIHGHTHRPAVHRFEINQQPATRIVLGDWYEQGSMLRWTPEDYELIELPRD